MHTHNLEPLGLRFCTGRLLAFTIVKSIQNFPLRTARPAALFLCVCVCVCVCVCTRIYVYNRMYTSFVTWVCVNDSVAT